jgi:hypothetical protein
VIVHPDGGLFSGDQASFQVMVHDGPADVSRVPVVIELPGGRRLDSATEPISARSVGQAQFVWAWNTTGLSGTLPVTVTIDPRGSLGAADAITTNNSAVITLTLRPASELPADERGARWATQETACCRFHFVTGSAAERDLQQIVPIASDAVIFAENKFGEKPRSKLDIYLVGRVLGHGGFASDVIAISYLDRNYAADDLTQILRHEATHVLHRQLAGNLHTMIAEGVAVWAAGGHYKPEPIRERAAALLQSHEYIPLRQLAQDFYSHQHETGYLEAASVVEYLIERDGLSTFKQFLRTLGRERGDDADALDRALQQTYSQNLDAVEREWLDHLRTLTVSPRQRNDLDVTIAYYETVRRYEQIYDPSAYYRQVWIPDLRRAESSNIVADWVRHPRADENVALETMLIAAHDAQLAGDWVAARQMLASVNAILDASGAFRDPSAAQYLALVRAARAAGWEPQRITLSDSTATIMGVRPGGKPITLTFTLTSEGWRAR